jgi:hypothetical protein
MARRKRQILEDGDSDSSPDSKEGDDDIGTNDPDEQAERALFEDPYRRKRRKRDEEDSEDGEFEGERRRGAKSDWTKAPGFVSGQREDQKNMDASDFIADTTLSGIGLSRSAVSTSPLSAAERAHFNKIQGTFGARLLSKMGWQPGTGLGVTGEGIVTPVESKVRPQKKGLGHGGFKEKTEQSKAEARRRGEIVSDDEENEKRRKGGKKDRDKTSDAWKKPRKVRTRIEHKTYEQIVAEAGQDTTGQIIDATGAIVSRSAMFYSHTDIYSQHREVSSLADISLSSWTPSTDPTRIPEVRHNLQLIVESCKINLDGLAREARALAERKRWLSQEDARLRKKVQEEAECEYLCFLG